MRAFSLFIIVGLTAAALVIFSALIWWTDVSKEVVHVSFSQDRSCKLEFHQWDSGRSVLSYYEHEVRVGTVTLNNDLFNDPIAMFPGPNDASVICLSWPDTFDAAFTVDFSKRSNEGMPIPERLRLDGQEAVDFSNFNVRACTPNEVASVRSFIERTDLKTYASYTRYGEAAANEESRKHMLRFLTLATSPNDWRDPVLMNAAPLLLPEDESIADGAP